MKKTLVRKLINGKEYFYLVYRKKGSFKSEYLGDSSSVKYKKYLFTLIKESGSYALEKARKKNHAAGVPVVYVEDGFLVDEYRNGVKEYLDNKLKVVKVEVPNE